MEMIKDMWSVIVPVYKVEKYLEECVESILAQDYRPMEIVLVDDGSPDRSGEMCDRYAAEHPDIIRVIHKENGGLSSARNAGLDAARGEFIAFIDSDDKILPGMGTDTIEAMKKRSRCCLHKLCALWRPHKAYASRTSSYDCKRP